MKVAPVAVLAVNTLPLPDWSNKLLVRGENHKPILPCALRRSKVFIRLSSSSVGYAKSEPEVGTEFHHIEQNDINYP